MGDKLKKENWHDMAYLNGLGVMLIDRLKDKSFDIVSFHSKFNQGPYVLENCQLKSSIIEVKDTLVKIHLKPFRSISFDLHEDPKVTIESDRQIKIVRKLNSKDTVTRIILINDILKEEENAQEIQ